MTQKRDMVRCLIRSPGLADFVDNATLSSKKSRDPEALQRRVGPQMRLGGKMAAF
jgi:hypothetical protein